MTQKLSDLCTFVDGRVAIADLDLDNYISTENMLPNKEGVSRSAGLPTVSQTQVYQAENVLVSNIRPYFPKIWLADRKSESATDLSCAQAISGGVNFLSLKGREHFYCALTRLEEAG
jgi:type I restriction enzyme S subunit